MTCPDCQRLQEENTRLQRENDELRRRLAAYENPHKEDLDPLNEAVY